MYLSPAQSQHAQEIESLRPYWQPPHSGFWMDLGKKQPTAFSPPRAGGLLGTKKAPDLSAPEEALTRNHRHLEHLTWLGRAGRAFLGCSHEHRRQPSAEAALGCLSAVLDLAQRPRTGAVSVGSRRGSSAGPGVPGACLAASRGAFSGRPPSSEVWALGASSGIHTQGQAVLRSLPSRRE